MKHLKNAKFLAYYQLRFTFVSVNIVMCPHRHERFVSIYGYGHFPD